MKQLPLCAHCGVNRVPRPEQKFCSRDCWRTHKAHTPQISNCQMCGKEFVQPQTHRRKACSKECSHALTSTNQQKQADYVCKTCGKKFTGQACRNRRFCSRACSHKGRSQPRQEMETVLCIGCGQQFKRPVNWVSKKSYCSKQCRIDSNRANLIRKACKNCGKSFHVQKMEKNRKFCCHECYTTWNTGENHVLHVGEHDDYYGRNWQQQRRKARKRDGYKCQHCGATEKKIGRELDVHHIKPFRSFPGGWAKANRLTNLICLCPRCHKLAEHEKIPVQPSLL